MAAPVLVDVDGELGDAPVAVARAVTIGGDPADDALASAVRYGTATTQDPPTIVGAAPKRMIARNSQSSVKDPRKRPPSDLQRYANAAPSLQLRKRRIGYPR